VYASPISASMRFSEASTAFLDSRDASRFTGNARIVTKNTYKDYAKKLKALGVFFGKLPLNQIHLGNFVRYQEMRSRGEGWTRKLGKEVVQSPAGAEKVNAELRLLIRIMKLAMLSSPKRTPWQEANEPPDHTLADFAANLLQIESLYKKFQVIESDIPRALSAEQQEKYLQIAASNPDWHRLWWYSLVAKHLTFSSDEMRTIRIGDINLTYQIIGVNRRYGKNKYRRREIPITDGACLWALANLIEWCRARGGGQPHHFLFPGRLVRNVFDHETHMSETGLRKSHEAVRDKADLPWFQFNGWRHTAITNMAQDGVPIAIIMERAGHVTPKMSAHYTHISVQAHRLAVQPDARKKPVASVTAQDLIRGIPGWQQFNKSAASIY
jgi:integrase